MSARGRAQQAGTLQVSHPPYGGGYKCLCGVSVLPHQSLSCGGLVFVAPTVQPLGAPGDCCPDPLFPSPESYKCPVSPGAIPSPQQALALQLPTCKTPAVMPAFARHCMDNPGCLSPHHGGDALAEALARAAPGVGNHLPRQDQLFPSCATSSHTQQLPNTSFPLFSTRKEEAKPLNE